MESKEGNYDKKKKKKKNIWTGKYVEDKDTEIYRDYFIFEYDEKTYESTYKEELLCLLRRLCNKEGFTHITIWVDSRVENVFRISKVDKNCYDNWIGVINDIEKGLVK